MGRLEMTGEQAPAFDLDRARSEARARLLTAAKEISLAFNIDDNPEIPYTFAQEVRGEAQRVAQQAILDLITLLEFGLVHVPASRQDPEFVKILQAMRQQPAGE